MAVLETRTPLVHRHYAGGLGAPSSDRLSRQRREDVLLSTHEPAVLRSDTSAMISVFQTPTSRRR
jgi:hypothetical protein